MSAIDTVLARAAPRRPGTPAPGPSRRRRPVLVAWVWAALFMNVLAFSESTTMFPIPRTVGQLITQGALGLALLFALLANRRGVVRPSLFLVLLALLAVGSLMVSLHNQYLFGSTFRASRLLVFVVVLWMLTPWFGRRDMLLLRCHRICLWAVLGSVMLGAAISPGLAFSFEGRLSGTIWPVPPTQVAHYAAGLLGTTLVLWLCRVISGRNAAITLTVTAVVLVATHTRTALVAAGIALVVAGGSLFLGHVRVRRVSALGAVLGVVAGTLFASQLTAWALRGQSAQDAGDLTGRTKVWSQVFGIERPHLADLFGSGMSNMSFNGLPIDSNWVATYVDQGWFGMIVEAGMLLALLWLAVTHVRGPQRGVALFLIVYCMVASITEVGLSNPSPYVLDLTVAAALLAPKASVRGGP